jgi:hypothetical protein
VLLGVSVLIADPGEPAVELGGAVVEHGIERDPAEPGESRDRSPQTVRDPRERVVHADDDDAARTGEAREGPERRRGIRRVVQHPGAVHDIERARSQRGSPQIHLDEPRPVDAEAARGVGGEPQRCPREIRSHDEPVAGREEQAHLPGPAAELEHGRIGRDRLVQQTGELAPRSARAERLVAVARRVSGEWRHRVEIADLGGTRIERAMQYGDAVPRGEGARAAAAAQPRVPDQPAAARGTREERQEVGRDARHQKME